MVFAKLLKKRMFVLVLISFAFLHYLGGAAPEFYGVNKTVRWQWDVSNWLLFFKSIEVIVFLFGYGFLMLIRKETNRNISLIHLIVILILNILNGFFSLPSTLLLSIYVLSASIFLLNFVWAIKNKELSK